ncbi:MAG: hypothetical protein BWK76_18165 [Desulfobulbaceae bacterium A2]|nr:MAG: hypothetical protein BWK76_18165 [Desulfobulbaceae bacterium A2]
MVKNFEIGAGEKLVYLMASTYGMTVEARLEKLTANTSEIVEGARLLNSMEGIFAIPGVQRLQQ